MKQTILFLSISLLSHLAISQQTSQEVLDEILFYADITANAEDFKHQQRAEAELTKLLEQEFDKGNRIEFDSIKWISNVSPPDSSFNIVSWQLQLAEDKYTYKGYLFLEDRYIKLNDKIESYAQNWDFIVGNKDMWLGQLYYNVLPFEKGAEKCYMLFGYNALDQYENLKVAEVLTFDENGDPVFGKQVFTKEGEDLRSAKSRLILQYSDASAVSLNYNQGLEIIMFDHLIDIKGTLPGQGMTRISDGSYEGYSLNEGLWYYDEKIFDHKYDEAPRPTPVLDEKSKDIFGKSKG